MNVISFRDVYPFIEELRKDMKKLFNKNLCKKFLSNINE